MESITKTIGGALLAVGNFILFILVSIIFLPSLLVVTLLQDYWADSLSDLFGL